MAKAKNVRKDDCKSASKKTAREDKITFWAHEKIGDFRRPPFGDEAKEECAILLRRLERGEKLELPQSRPMSSVGSGCHELRIRDRDANWRVIYFIDADAIVVLHIFAKKTQTTPHDVIELCQKRLKTYRDKRAQIERLKKGKPWTH